MVKLQENGMIRYNTLGISRKFMNVIKREKNQSMCAEREQVSIKKGNKQTSH